MQVLTEMTKLMKECWHNSPSVRPTALRLKKKLQKIAASDVDVKMNEATV